MSDSIIDELMADGAPFEVVEQPVSGHQIRVFKNAPDSFQTVFDSARERGDTEFVVHNERRLTYSAFFDEADRLAGYLANQAGVKPGQSVAIVMKNDIAWLQSFVAIVHIGAVAVLVNSRGEPASLRAALEDTDSVLAICDAPRAEAIAESGLDIAKLVTMPRDGDVGFADAVAAGEKCAAVPVKSDEPAVMFFTSGTTGRAKAAVLSHRNLVTGTMNTQLAMEGAFAKIAASYDITVEQLREHMPQSCYLLAFPLFHTAGCSAVFLTGLAIGAKLVLMDRWDGNQAVDLIEQEKISSISGVPAMHWDILNCPRSQEADLSSIASISCGGQAFPINVVEALQARFPNAVLGSGYGLTEASGAISQANGEAFVANPARSGQVLPMVDVRILNDDGALCAVGEAGEIQARGATIMQGYYGREEETAKALQDGWLHTGDIGLMDEDGFITIVDRKTDMVISGGENIYCVEVETALNKKHDIVQAVTFGLPDDRLGERLVAVVETANDDLSADDVLRFAQENLAAYKVPVAVVMRHEPFERNAMGKVVKQKLREDYADQFGA